MTSRWHNSVKINFPRCFSLSHRLWAHELWVSDKQCTLLLFILASIKKVSVVWVVFLWKVLYLPSISEKQGRFVCTNIQSCVESAANNHQDCEVWSREVKEALQNSLKSLRTGRKWGQSRTSSRGSWQATGPRASFRWAMPRNCGGGWRRWRG